MDVVDEADAIHDHVAHVAVYIHGLAIDVKRHCIG